MRVGCKLYCKFKDPKSKEMKSLDLVDTIMDAWEVVVNSHYEHNALTSTRYGSARENKRYLNKNSRGGNEIGIAYTM